MEGQQRRDRRRHRPTFDLAAAGHGDAGDVVSVDVSARDPQGHVSTGVSDSVTVANTAPVKGAVTVDPSTPTEGMALTATPMQFSDADGDQLSYTYAWFRNDQPIAGATAKTLPASTTAVGDTIRVEVRAGDGHGGTTEAATATVTVLEDAKLHQPVAGTVKISPEAPTTNATVTADPSGFTRSRR